MLLRTPMRFLEFSRRTLGSVMTFLSTRRRQGTRTLAGAQRRLLMKILCRHQRQPMQASRERPMLVPKAPMTPREYRTSPRRCT